MVPITHHDNTPGGYDVPATKSSGFETQRGDRFHHRSHGKFLTLSGQEPYSSGDWFVNFTPYRYQVEET